MIVFGLSSDRNSASFRFSDDSLSGSVPFGGGAMGCTCRGGGGVGVDGGGGGGVGCGVLDVYELRWTGG